MLIDFRVRIVPTKTLVNIALILGVPVLLAAQSRERKVFYFPKPLEPLPFAAPMKPLTRLADLKAKHKGELNWTELVVDDKYNRAEVISAAPGSKSARHLHADSPEYWV